MVSQLSSREFAKIVKGMFESLSVKIAIEKNGVHMGWHNNVGVYSQKFVGGAEIQTVGDNFAGNFIDEYWQPFNNGECDKISTYSFDNTILFHDSVRPSVKIWDGSGDLVPSVRS